MAQQRALNALEPFIALSKSASSPRAAVDLITQATSAPQTFVFAELLQTPNIQALRDSPEHVSHLRLLEIFSWGSMADYNNTPNLPPLNPQQQKKLQLLSLLPLCSSPQSLSYTSLQSALALPTDADLESLVTTAIYDNLLTAHLDPLNRAVRVTSVAPLRDLAPNAVPSLVATLDHWEARCQSTLDDIEAQIAEIKANAQWADLRDQKNKEELELALSEFEKNRNANGNGDGDGGMRGGDTAGPGRGKKSGSAGGGSRWGGILGKGGKRAAPMDGSAGGAGNAAGDVMDLDDQEGGGSKGPLRAAKRKGLGMR